MQHTDQFSQLSAYFLETAMLKPSSIAVAILTVLTTQLTTQQAWAEGYKLYEQSVSAMGNAYAGRGAQITDATLAYSNPAAISQLKQAQFASGVNLIKADTKYQNAAATSATGLAVTGKTAGKNSLIEAVPFVFYTDQLTDKVNYGLGFYVPFGLSSNYQDDWVGRYFADETAIEVLALQSSLSYQFNPDWAIGVGFSLNHATGTLSKFKDHGGLCELGAAINSLYRQDVYNANFCQSHYEVNGDDWAAGYSLGVFGRITPDLAIAMMYHSELKFVLRDDSTITHTPITGANVTDPRRYQVISPRLPAIDRQTGKLASTPILTEASRLALTTPSSVAISLDHQFSKAWSWQASLNWTGWSVFEEIAILSNSAQPTISLSTQSPENLAKTGYIGYIPQYWHDTLAGAIGLTYRHNGDLTLKTGLAYDENPIQVQRKNARVPTADRIWWTLGSTFTLTPTWSVDVAYGYLWMSGHTSSEREFNAADIALYQSGLTASFKNHAHVLGAQMNYRF